MSRIETSISRTRRTPASSNRIIINGPS